MEGVIRVGVDVWRTKKQDVPDQTRIQDPKQDVPNQTRCLQSNKMYVPNRFKNKMSPLSRLLWCIAGTTGLVQRACCWSGCVPQHSLQLIYSKSCCCTPLDVTAACLAACRSTALN